MAEHPGTFRGGPPGAILLADTFLDEALSACGYPAGDFEQRVTDISVEHPQAVEDYRIAHSVARRNVLGEASREDLRKAIRHYRNLHEDLLEIHVPQREEVYS